jgi:peptidyl-dipeptidase A
MTHPFVAFRRAAAILAAAGLLLAYAGPASAAQKAAATRKASKPTVEEARQFLDDAQKRLLDLTIEAGRASWVQETFITYDTETLAAARNEVLTGVAVELAKQATRFDGLQLPTDLRRQMELLKRGLVLPAPSDPRLNAELSRLAASLDAQYGAGQYCPPGGGPCKSLPEVDEIMRTSRDPKELLDTWIGWHKIAPPMRKDYARLVEIANQGARELGYKDTGVLWREKYDMPADAFGPELDRLWGQLKPLYDSLHCYVRARLNQKYGDAVVPLNQPIPAHLLGNMWAQEWDQIYDVVAPPGADPGYDLTKVLQDKKVDEKGMVKYGENFFVSLGFAPLPATFWERSLFKKPQDRDVVCHASAWDIDYKDDLRIKVCVKINDEDFRTVHHELGHNFYQRAYDNLPFLYEDSANDGFHEAVGDTIALSITPEYLKQIGLIDQVPDASKDIGLLMKKALEKVAFLPFGLLIDQWRWKVFSGEVTPANYNQAWWDLRLKYQGVRPPVARSEADFDPGAKYHVPANTPYMRYFLADILQFQLHRGLCQAAGYKGPLHRCSIYGNKEAGAKLAKMLEMGASHPWPDALEVVTGQRQMDATAIADYFAPLKTWLDQQNQGQTCGW